MSLSLTELRGTENSWELPAAAASIEGAGGQRAGGARDQRPGNAQTHTIPIAQLLLTAFPCSPPPPLASLGKLSQVASLPASGHQVA